MPLFIYTDSIEKNVDEIRKYTNRKIIAVMKSNAYELGSKKIIPILRKKGVDFFAFEKSIIILFPVTTAFSAPDTRAVDSD